MAFTSHTDSTSMSSSRYSAKALWQGLLMCLALTTLLSACGTNVSVDERQLTGDELVYSNPAEARRAFAAAAVRIPTATGEVIETSGDALVTGAVSGDQTYPTVIWMHGCAGFWSGTYERINWLARNGFAVVAPNSMAREFYPLSCDPETFRSGLYRPTVQIRQLDVRHAIEQLRQLPWVDANNLFLAGFSEGAAVAAVYVDDTVPGGALKARMSEGWVCHAGWEELDGLNLPEGQPILTLVADQDPWYTRDFHQGDCGEFMDFTNGSQSVVVNYEPARRHHALWEQPGIREVMLDFLLQQANRP